MPSGIGASTKQAEMFGKSVAVAPVHCMQPSNRWSSTLASTIRAGVAYKFHDPSKICTLSGK
jgi:hypothetical protein